MTWEETVKSAVALLLILAPLVVAADYPSPAEITLPSSPFAPQIAADPLRFMQETGDKAISFLGVGTFLRRLQNIDYYNLFTRGRQFVELRLPEYRAEFRRWCGPDCNLPNLIHSGWNKVKSWFGR